MNQKPPPHGYGTGGGGGPSSSSNTIIGTLSAHAKQTTRSMITKLRGGGGPSSSSNTIIGTLSARTNQTTQSMIATLRPWRELLDLSALSPPHSYDEAMARVRQNISYFRANYALAVLSMVILGLFYHPISIIVCIAWILLYFSRVISEKEVDDRILLVLLSLVTILTLVYTDVGENVLVSLVIGLLIVGAHGAIRSTDDLFLDEESARLGGLVTGTNRPSI